MLMLFVGRGVDKYCSGCSDGDCSGRHSSPQKTAHTEAVSRLLWLPSAREVIKGWS